MTKIKNTIYKFGKEVIVVTGGIGSGKSFVMDVFKGQGLHVFNSDEYISNLMEPDGPAYNKIIDLAPGCLQDGCIDKKMLSKLAFSNKSILSNLEGILYPFLREYRDGWIKEIKKQSDISIAIEIPLYFEKKVEIDKNIVLSTICPVHMQRVRALARNKMDLQTIDSIIAEQVSNQYREKHSDILIYTDLSHADTIKQLEFCLDYT